MHAPALFSTILSFATMTLVAGFAADPSINAQGILNTAMSSGQNIVASFPSSPDSGDDVNIFGDWLDLDGVSAYYFIADMQVDCDGVDYRCPHNPDGQPLTSFGRLSATRVPYYVLPQQFYNQYSSSISPNALGAIICNGKMFYGIFGDTDGDDPETIGEASILLAQTCFPDDGLDGGSGHDPLDVLYVVFGNEVPSGVGDERINIHALKKLGDEQATALANALGV